MSSISRASVMLLVCALWPCRASADTYQAGGASVDRYANERGYRQSEARPQAAEPPTLQDAPAGPGRNRPLVHFEPAANREPNTKVRPASFAVDAEAPKLAPQGREKSLPLAPRGAETAARRGATDRLGSLVTLGSSLAVVVGLFLVVAWMMRRGMPKGLALLPRGAVEVLGRTPLAARQQMHLVRCGNKLLLVCASMSGIETLTEITDPAEIDRLVGMCQSTKSGSSTRAFENVLAEFEQPVIGRGTRRRETLDMTDFADLGARARGDADV